MLSLDYVLTLILASILTIKYVCLDQDESEAEPSDLSINDQPTNSHAAMAEEASRETASVTGDSGNTSAAVSRKSSDSGREGLYGCAIGCF